LVSCLGLYLGLRGLNSDIKAITRKILHQQKPGEVPSDPH